MPIARFCSSLFLLGLVVLTHVVELRSYEGPFALQPLAVGLADEVEARPCEQ